MSHSREIPFSVVEAFIHTHRLLRKSTDLGSATWRPKATNPK